MVEREEKERKRVGDGQRDRKRCEEVRDEEREGLGWEKRREWKKKRREGKGRQGVGET